MIVTLLNYLFLSLRTVMYQTVRKITTCRVAIGQWPFTQAKQIQEPNTTSHSSHCFLPVPQEVGVRFKGGDKHNLMSVTGIQRVLLPQHKLLPSPTEKQTWLDPRTETILKRSLCYRLEAVLGTRKVSAKTQVYQI